MRRHRTLWVASGLTGAVLLSLAGCSRAAPSTVDPAGYGARRVAGLWWVLFWISAAVFSVVVTLLLWALIRRRRPDLRVRAGEGTRFVVVAGAVLPFLILTVVYGLSLDVQTALGTPRPADLTIQVTGHDWWWEIRYPAAGAVTANEIHIPVGKRVAVDLQTADVVHSFWVPQLAPKTDTIAGRTNQTWLLADKPGSYRGQCAEYCGLQHAHMALMVVAQPQADFDSWLARLVRPAAPQTAAERRGMLVFEQSACATCHAVTGTTARGTVGPNLSNVGSRWSIGAGTVPNDAGHLGGWIANSQTVKPGNNMPPQQVPAGQLPDLIAYLESLK